MGATVPSKTPYVPVDPKLYQGKWTGKYANNKSFKISVSNVNGFRAKVQYQSGGTNKFAEVLIKDNAFRIGDTKFMLTKIGTAEIKTVIIDPGERADLLDTAYAKHRAAEAAFGSDCSSFSSSDLAVGGEQPRRRVLAQIQRAEIGAAAQHRLFGKLLHHKARPAVDHLIDDRGRVAIDHHLMRQGRARETTAGIVAARTLASIAVTLWRAGSSVATAWCAASLTG